MPRIRGGFHLTRRLVIPGLHHGERGDMGRPAETFAPLIFHAMYAEVRHEFFYCKHPRTTPGGFLKMN